MRSGAKREAGIALLLAVSVLAALGVITVTGLVLARAERVAGLAALARVQARGAAETVLADAVRGWPAALTPVLAGQEAVVAGFTGPGPAAGQASIRSLGGSVYAIRAQGARLSQAGDTLGAIRLELLVLLGSPDSNAHVNPALYPRGWRLLP